jgi:hypothetical protein
VTPPEALSVIVQSLLSGGVISDKDIVVKFLARRTDWRSKGGLSRSTYANEILAELKVMVKEEEAGNAGTMNFGEVPGVSFAEGVKKVRVNGEEDWLGVWQRRQLRKQRRGKSFRKRKRHREEPLRQRRERLQNAQHVNVKVQEELERDMQTLRHSLLFLLSMNSMKTPRRTPMKQICNPRERCGTTCRLPGWAAHPERKELVKKDLRAAVAQELPGQVQQIDSTRFSLGPEFIVFLAFSRFGDRR